jgi:hypothetical protein
VVAAITIKRHQVLINHQQNKRQRSQLQKLLLAVRVLMILKMIFRFDTYHRVKL